MPEENRELVKRLLLAYRRADFHDEQFTHSFTGGDGRVTEWRI